jgi:hypothetical protein
MIFELKDVWSRAKSGRKTIAFGFVSEASLCFYPLREVDPAVATRTVKVMVTSIIPHFAAMGANRIASSQRTLSGRCKMMHETQPYGRRAASQQPHHFPLHVSIWEIYLKLFESL